MMKSAENRPRGEMTEPLNRPMRRRVIAQGLMRSEFVVVARGTDGALTRANAAAAILGRP